MIDGAWLVLRAAGLVLALQAAGSALFSAVFGPHLSSARAAVATAGARCARAALAVLFAQLLFEPVYLAGDWSALADAAALRLVLISPAGAALLTRLGGTLCIALALPAAGAARRRLALIGAAAIVASFALTGHTAVNAWRALLAPLLLTHIAIVTFWFGSLGPLRQVLRLEPAAQAAAAVARFSAFAVWLVPLIAVAGIGMALLLLPDAAALRRPYGLMLLTKAALFALLMGLAAVNRLRLAPALARSQAREPLRRTLALEFVLICVVLAVTALLTGRYSPAE
jgi:putative copper export protein